MSRRRQALVTGAALRVAAALWLGTSGGSSLAEALRERREARPR